MSVPSCYFLLCGRITQGPGFPTKTKLAGSWAGVRLLLNWQKFAGDSNEEGAMSSNSPGTDWPHAWLAWGGSFPHFSFILNITRIWWHTDHPAMSLALVGCLSGHLASWHWWHYASKCDHRVSLGDTNGHKHRPHPWEGAGHFSLLISLEKLTSWTRTGVLRALSWDDANHMERWCLLKLRMSKYYH